MTAQSRHGPPKEVEADAPHHQDDRPTTNKHTSNHAATDTTQASSATRNSVGYGRAWREGFGSAAVAWFEVHEFVAPFLENVGTWPMVGSVQWQQLSADDPRKLAAIFDAARHHALRVEIAQEIRGDASRAISGAADWPSIGRELQQLSEFRKSRPWARRVAS
jgi:hypothetical protein